MITHVVSLPINLTWEYFLMRVFLCSKICLGLILITLIICVRKDSSHWQADTLEWWDYRMHTEDIQNLPKLNVRPSFKMKRDAKNTVYNLTKFKELKGLRINHETWKIHEWSSKTTSWKLYISNINTVGAKREAFYND